MRTQALRGLLAIGLLVGSSTFAWSDDKEGNIADLVKDAKVTVEQAIKTAMEKVPGTVVEAELEKKHGKTVWEVEILGADGKVTEVHIDAATGTVIDTEAKKDKHEDKKERKSKDVMAKEPKLKSHDLLVGPGRAPARAMLKAVGFTDEDLSRPFIGVANTWIEVMPCNFHLRRLSERVKAGIRAAGGTPIEYNTIAVSDGISMGTEGMKASLISREVIADSIELVARGHLFDGVVALSGCDKTIPGTVMALARLNVPSLMLYGGSIMPGQFQGHDVTIQDVFEAVGKHASGKMTNAELKDLEDHACPGPGACGGQFTANTMAIAFEFLGMSPMGRNGVPAMDARKDDVAFECGKMVMDLLKRDLRPRQIITRKSLENAIAAVATTGGSTNAVLHLLAIAYEAGIKLSIDDFDKINRKVPLLADLKPGGRFAAADLYAAGGTTLVAKRLVDAGLLHANQPTVTGRTIGEEAKEAEETAGQQVLRPLSNPIKPTGGLVILKGNLAPEGCVVKVAGHSMMQFRGPGQGLRPRRGRVRRPSRPDRSRPATSS